MKRSNGKPQGYDTFDRVAVIANILHRGGVISAKGLIERFGYTRRSMYRDLNKIETTFPVIRSGSGINASFRMIKD